MAERKSYLLRLPPDLLDDLNRWAADELRSVNAQIEFVLREAMRKRKRDDAKTLLANGATSDEQPNGIQESTDRES